MASGADASTEESDASSSSHPTPTTIDGSKDSLDRPADSARSVGGANGKKILVLPKQAMPAALGPRQTSEADMGDGDVPMPWWYTPRRLLLLYCLVWGMVYVDQGLLSSNGVTGTRSTDPSNSAVGADSQGGLQADFNLSYAQLGLLPALYMAGLIVACLMFNELTNYVNSFRLVGIGLAMWALGAVFTGVSFNYSWLLFARIFTGAGEASVMTLTGPFIDDVAPPASKARWFAWLSLTPTLGVAIGYKLGDLTEYLNWRILFYIEAGVAVPVVLFCLLAPAVRLRGKLTQVHPEVVLFGLFAPAVRSYGKLTQVTAEGAEDSSLAQGIVPAQQQASQGWWSRCTKGTRELWEEVKALHKQPMFLANNWGFVPVQAAIGVFTFWGPKAAKEILRADDDTVSSLLAGLTLGTGVIGTLGGGWILDKVGSSLRNAMILQMVAASVALIASVLAFMVAPSLAAFAPLLAIGLLGIFVVQAPLYAVSMWTVPVPLRPAGQAFQVICMHMFGDVPLPPVIGVIQGQVKNWRISMTIVAALLSISVGCYLFGVLYSPWGKDYRIERQAASGAPPPDEEVPKLELPEEKGRVAIEMSARNDVQRRR